MLNITTFLDANAWRLSKPVFRCPERGTEYSSAEILSIASEMARDLQARGIRKGQRVLIYLESSPEYLFSYFAIWRLGAIAVPCNRVYTTDELAFLAEDSGASLVITDAEGVQRAAALPSPLPAYVPGPIETFRTAPILPPEHTDTDDLCQLQYTSGTTGRPKGAMLTHGNWLAAIHNECDVLDCRQSDTYLGIYPMGHVGLSWGLAAMRAAAVYVMMSRYKLDSYLDICRSQSVTLLAGMPPVIHSLLGLPSPVAEQALSSVRGIISGGGPLHHEIWRRFHSRFHIPVLNAYGLSETIVIGTGTVIRPEDYATADRFQSVGHPVCFSEVKIVDETNPSLEKAQDEPGEIALRGPAVACGYWNRPDATAEAFLPDGWFLTGDIGYLDSEHRLFITDRKKDMIVMSGWKIYPTEVEDVLLRHPGVAEIAVFGMVDEHSGERPAVAVVWKDGWGEDRAQELIDFAKEHLAGYKVPRQIFSVKSLPRVNGWKLLRRELRATFHA